MMIFIMILPISIEAKTLKIGFDKYLPMTGEPNTNEEGVVIEIVELIFKKYQIKYLNTPYIRGIYEVEEGKIDIYLGAAQQDFKDKTKVLFPQEPLQVVNMNFFVTKENKWSYKDLKSLKGIKLGLVSGIDYPEFNNITDKSLFNYLSGSDTTSRNLRLLLKGRIDVIYEDNSTVNYYAKKLGITKNIKQVGSVINPLKIYLVISTKNPSAQKLANDFDIQLRNMRKTKQLARILEKYNVADWK